MPKVTVIIPFYNSQATIQETVNSVLNQPYQDLDICIIDDGSTEAAFAELKKLEKEPKIKVLRQANAGPSVARNLGLANTKSEYVFFIDADDLLMPGILTEAVQLLDSDAGLGVVYGKGEYFGATHDVYDPEDFEHFNFLFKNPLFISCLVRRCVLDEVGGFDNYYSKLGLEDWDLWLTIGQTRWRFKKINKVFIKVRVAPTSRTFRDANNNLEGIYNYLYKKHSQLVVQQLKQRIYELNDIKRTPEYKLGKLILAPIRFLTRKKAVHVPKP